MLRVTVRSGTDLPVRPRFKDFELFRLELADCSERHITLLPSRSAIRQGFGFLLFMLIISAVLLGLGFLIVMSAEPVEDTSTALILGVSLIAAPALFGVLTLLQLTWLRFDMRAEEKRRIRFFLRAWRKTEQVNELADLIGMDYGVVPEAIMNPRIQSTSKPGPVAKYWIWFVALSFENGRQQEIVRLKIEAVDWTERPPRTPPESVRQICKWLAVTTGISVEHRPYEASR